MKLIFLVERQNYYRFFFPVIREALSRGFEVECWHNNDPQLRKGNKSYLFPDLSRMPKFDPYPQPKTRVYCDRDQLSKFLLNAQGVDFVVVVNRPEAFFEEGLLSQVSFKWVTLMTGPDSFMDFVNIKKAFHLDPGSNLFFVLSDEWKTRGKVFFENYFPHLSSLMDDRFVSVESVGFPEFDMFSEIDSDRVREKYGIPKGKKILLYLPFTFFVREKGFAWARAFSGFWTNRGGSPFYNVLYKIYDFYCIVKDPVAWKCFRDGFHEKNLIRAVKAFCLKNDLILAVKPRKKFAVAEEVIQAADLMVWDEEDEYSPPVLKELLSVAEMTLSYQSFGGFTGVFANVFNLNCLLPEQMFYADEHKYWYLPTESSMWNFPGVCESWEIGDVIKNISDLSIERFLVHPERRFEYVQKFMGFDDFHSSKRVMDHLVRVYEDAVR